MKYQISILLILICAIVNAQPKELRKEGKRLKSELKGNLTSVLEIFNYVPGGTVIRGTSLEGITTTDRDSTLVFYTPRIKADLQPFFIEATEVTNNQYRAFVHWVRDSLARTNMAKRDDRFLNSKGYLNWDVVIDWTDSLLRSEMYTTSERFMSRDQLKTQTLNYICKVDGKDTILNVYPDTNCWFTEEDSYQSRTMAEVYFWHPAMDDYPVVGVSWYQAHAYCHWLTQRCDQLLAPTKATARLVFRLPTEDEWQFAALGEESEDLAQQKIYPWNGWWHRIDGGQYCANFGDIIGQNSLRIKDKITDGAFNTCKVKTYDANGFGLYNMAGNVSEWTSSSPEKEALILLRMDGESTSAKGDSLSKYFYFGANPLPMDHRAQSYQRKSKVNELIVHGNSLIEKTDRARIVKGGSWADGPIYMYCGVKEVVPVTSSSSKTGFRVVMEIDADRQH